MNESFWLIGQPDVPVERIAKGADQGKVRVSVRGGGMMIDEQKLQQAVQRIVAVAQPSRVILFGSYGRGDADAGSDLDLMVIKPQVVDKYTEMIHLHKAVGSIGVGVDVLVYSDAEVEERRDWCTSPVYWALREGRTLYVAQ